MKSLLNLAEFLKFMSFFSDDISRPLLLVVEKDILFFVFFIHSVLNMLIKVKGYVPIRSMLHLHSGEIFSR